MAATFPGVCAVVPAAGFGRRMQTECPKQYLSIGNKTILEHAVAALLADARVQRVVIAVSPAIALQPAAAGAASANYRGGWRR